MSEERDPQIDDALREVPIPEGMLDRLRGVVRLTDKQMDEALVSVRLPGGMMDRLHAAVADEMLDESVREVPLPWGMVARLRNIPLVRPRSRLARLAVAASLFLMFGTSYLAMFVGIAVAVKPPEVKEIPIELPYDGPLEIEARFETVHVEVASQFVETLVSAPDPAISLDVPPPELSKPRTLGPVGELVASLDTGLLAKDAILLRYQILGKGDVADEQMPELTPSPALPSGGIEPPFVREYNRRFLLQHGVHPVSFPGANKQLQTTVLPASTATTSFDRMLRDSANGRLPDAFDVRVEDFIAVTSGHYSRAKPGTVEVRVDGGPSEFGQVIPQHLATESRMPRVLAQQPATLIQVGVVAGEMPRQQKPTNLTIALDVSASMRWDGRLDVAKRALKNLLDHLGPRDQFSFVAFNQQVTQSIEHATPVYKAQLIEMLDALNTSGGTNLGAGLPAAVSIGLNSPWEPDPASKLVLITDGSLRLDDEVRSTTQDLLRSAVSRGLEVSIIELDDDGSANPYLEDLADAAGGELHETLSHDHLRWTLVDILMGQSSIAASEVAMKVTFRPEVVAAYRLLGHEPVSVIANDPVSIGCELHDRQAVSTMLEIWFAPGASDDVIGSAIVTWRSNTGGRLNRVRRPIRRSEFAKSRSTTALSLQAAMIAAETAEVLRESPFAQSRGRNLKHVLAAAERVSPYLAERPGFKEFVAAVRQAEQIRSRVGGDR